MFSKLNIFKEKKTAIKIAPALEGQKMFLSKTMLNLCKTDGCGNKRRAGSAYCGNCKKYEDESKK